MTANLRPFVFIVTSCTFYLLMFVISHTSACFTATETSTELWKDELQESIEIYKKFSDSVFAALSELGENNTETEVETYDDGGSVASLIGVSYILISTSELQFWAVSYPGFDNVIQNITDNMYSAFDVVLYDIQDVLKFSNLMFVPSIGENINSSVTLEIINSRNSMNVISVDFEDDEATIPLINQRISSFTKDEIQYIPDGVLISSSTMAIIVNVVETKLKWATPGTSIGRKIFNQREEVEMIQFSGEVKVIERNSEVEVFLFFENRKSGLALRMPKDISADRSVANIEEMQAIDNFITAAIQMPLLNYTLRSQYNLDDENSTNCNFEKQDNVLQLLDVLTSVYVGPQFFEMTAVSGGQINNVEKYKEEIRLHENLTPKRVPLFETKSAQKSLSTDILQSEEAFDGDYSETMNENTISHSVEKDGQKPRASKDSLSSSGTNATIHKIGSSTVVKKEKVIGTVDNEEKIITFDRGFTWLFFDDYIVPIVAGVVTSFKLPEEETPPNFSFLGMENGKGSPYIQCF